MYWVSVKLDCQAKGANLMVQRSRNQKICDQFAMVKVCMAPSSVIACFFSVLTFSSVRNCKLRPKKKNDEIPLTGPKFEGPVGRFLKPLLTL